MLCLTLGLPLKEAARGQSETVLVNLSTVGTQDLHVPTVSSARHDRRCRLVETEDQRFFASSLQLTQRFYAFVDVSVVFGRFFLGGASIYGCLLPVLLQSCA